MYVASTVVYSPASCDVSFALSALRDSWAFYISFTPIAQSAQQEIAQAHEYNTEWARARTYTLSRKPGKDFSIKENDYDTTRNITVSCYVSSCVILFLFFFLKKDLFHRRNHCCDILNIRALILTQTHILTHSERDRESEKRITLFCCKEFVYVFDTFLI